MNIQEFNYNQKILEFFIIKKIEARTSKNESVYIDVNLADTNREEINGKIWSAVEIDLNKFKTGVMVKVSGMVQKYNNKKQLNIDKIRLVVESDEVNIEDYVEAAPTSSECMIEEVNEYIDKISNDQIKELTRVLFNSKEEKLKYYPAAKTHHHDIKGGLLFHITTMLNLGEKISESYGFINTDLLYSGVILHDLSKVDEIISNELGIVENYSTQGKLLGHIIQGINEIDRVARELDIDDEIKLLIQHMILSHHYHPEYGSPKKPLIPEAELLHYLDIVDARMYAMNKLLSNVSEGEFSERSFSLDGRSMYKSSIKSEVATT
ncbi:HD domain-containing protein [Alkalibaculum sp. M08DMB]|uniref:HD domain-containing protein n=1 Tax=Alkalibaculum sporogenes TaxID=2655001 RepID=A0A6A7K7C5_9FIRM|nr:HD domain-containing protein [Alkalibaculum sporogenes]MPW25275.1 HD domain-containing protein [Alkalibaculum sporogenes]